MSRYATFVIDKEMDQGEETIQQLFSLFGHENSQIVAASKDNEILRIELIESLIQSNSDPYETVECVREILDASNLCTISEAVVVVDGINVIPERLSYTLEDVVGKRTRPFPNPKPMQETN